MLLDGRYLMLGRVTKVRAPVRTATVVAIVATAVASAGCKRGGSAASGQTDAGIKVVADAGASARPSLAFPVAPDVIAKAVNPKSQKPYEGPTGTIRGVVRVTGDPPPEWTDVLSRVSPRCAFNKEAYRTLFRVGPDRAAADVLVAATGFSEYVPDPSPARRIIAKNCSYETRTVAVTYGQRIDVVAKDAQGYVPRLFGDRAPAQFVAIPGGDPVPLFPERPGRYLLTDTSKPFMNASVFVLKYATHDVTGVDGRYEIARIPVGEVTLSAYLPLANETTEKRVKVEAGKVHELDLELNFDLARYRASLADAGAPSAGEPAAGGAADGGAVPSGGAADAGD